MNLNQLTITEAKKKLEKKEVSSVELVQACLDEIKKQNSNLNAFITVSEKEALADAKKADEARKKDNPSALLGIPIALKDNFVTKGIKTTAASKVLENYIPRYDATVVKKIKEAGAVIIGKTNHDAWAHGSSGENSDFGPTKNPWNNAYVPGGSSSGSAAAVTADLCLAATGTDTGGSIRLPASFCNVVGLKPTYGRVSRHGVIAMASSLDSIGHLTKTVEDSALLLNVTAGEDRMDATSPPVPVPNYLESIKKGIKGMRIGVYTDYFNNRIDKDCGKLYKASSEVLKRVGAEIVDVVPSHNDYTNACYYIIQPAEVSSNLARYDGIRYGRGREFFGDEAKRRIMLGTYTLSSGYYDAYYKKAMQVRTILIQDFKKVFEVGKLDAIISPVSPTPPWKLGEKTDDPLKMYLSDIFTVSANLLGIPGLSLPSGFINGLPVGIQILGPQFSEETLFQIGYAYQQATPFHTERPNL